MEMEGHPSQDLIEELARRGAIRAEGTTGGPNPESLRFLTENLGDERGFWLYLPREVFFTGMDEIPAE